MTFGWCDAHFFEGGYDTLPQSCLLWMRAVESWIPSGVEHDAVLVEIRPGLLEAQPMIRGTHGLGSVVILPIVLPPTEKANLIGAAAA